MKIQICLLNDCLQELDKNVMTTNEDFPKVVSDWYKKHDVLLTGDSIYIKIMEE